MQILIRARRCVRLLICATILFGGVTFGQSLSAPEYKIKAAFIYNFALLTEWPADAFTNGRAPLKIGILGENPFGEFLQETVSGKTVHGREIIVQHLKEIKEAEHCHLLFITVSEHCPANTIVSALNHRPILTVGESDAFENAGGMIRLFHEDKRIRFTVNNPAVQRAGLKLSSKLLALGKQTRSIPAKEE